MLPVLRAVSDTRGQTALVALRALERHPTVVFTADGWMRLEDDYIPRVVTREAGPLAPEALKAQAVAARTFVLRAMRDVTALGTPAKPIESSTRFQLYARGHASSVANEAELATRGIVARWNGQLILANYVAGATWRPNGAPASDPTGTEKWVTYNEGRVGSAVVPTKLGGNSSRPDNRGCLSANGAEWLARHGWDYPAILRFFYGADLELDGAIAPTPIIATSAPDSSSATLTVLAFGAAALALVFAVDETNRPSRDRFKER